MNSSVYIYIYALVHRFHSNRYLYLAIRFVRTQKEYHCQLINIPSVYLYSNEPDQIVPSYYKLAILSYTYTYICEYNPGLLYCKISSSCTYIYQISIHRWCKDAWIKMNLCTWSVAFVAVSILERHLPGWRIEKRMGFIHLGTTLCCRHFKVLIPFKIVRYSGKKNSPSLTHLFNSLYIYNHHIFNFFPPKKNTIHLIKVKNKPMHYNIFLDV